MAGPIWSLLASLVLGGWLWRASRIGGDSTVFDRRHAGWLRGSLQFLSVVCLLTGLLLALFWLPYPFEAEWRGGAMRDHCLRLLQGQPLYAAPGPDWIPLAQPPLYFWICALGMSVFGSESFAVMRAVSLACALGCAGLLYVWVRRLTILPPSRADQEEDDFELVDYRRRSEERRGRVYSRTAAGLFLAAFGVTEGAHSLEHSYTLFLLLAMAMGYCLTLSATPGRLAFPALLTAGFAGLLSTLALLTNPLAVLYVLGGMVGLLWRRAWLSLAFFTLVTGVSGGEIVWILNIVTEGWFGYYAFRVPLAADGAAQDFARVWLRDLLLFAPVLLLSLLALWRRGTKPPAAASANLRILAAMTGAAMLVSLTDRALGGGASALLPLCAFCGALGCATAGRWEGNTERLRGFFYALLLAQLLALTTNPFALLPTAANAAAGRRFAWIVQRLEKDGAILSLDHGGFTRAPRLHITALRGVLQTEGRLPTAFVAALRSQRYTAILMDKTPQPGDPIHDALLQDYGLAEGPDLGGPWVLSGYRTPPPNLRSWILRPRLPRGASPVLPHPPSPRASSTDAGPRYGDTKGGGLTLDR